MANRMRLHGRHLRKQAGVTAVEFALVAAFVYFPIMLGIASFGRWLYTLNAASEATRYGARIAVVCDIGAAGIKDRMQIFLPQAADENISIVYSKNSPGACTEADCETVTVSLSNLSVGGLLWFAPPGGIPLLSYMPIPAFSHTLTRESMQSTSNPICS